MTKIRNSGGVRRNVELGCGFIFRGDPDRLDLQLRLHKKKCEHCKDSQLIIKKVPVIKDHANGYIADTDPGKNLQRIKQQFIE